MAGVTLRYRPASLNGKAGWYNWDGTTYSYAGETLDEVKQKMTSATQIKSYEQILEEVPQLERDILDALASRPSACFELERHLERSHQTVSGRLWALVRKGLVEATNVVRYNHDTKRDQTVYQKSNNWANPEWKAPKNKGDRLNDIKSIVTSVTSGTMSANYAIDQIKEIINAA